MRRFSTCSMMLCVLLAFLLLPMSSFGVQAKGKLKADSAKVESLIDINSADATALSSLPGIGPKIAGDIIEYRTGNGPFASVQDLEKVKGIGAKKIAKLKDLVTVKGPE